MPHYRRSNLPSSNLHDFNFSSRTASKKLLLWMSKREGEARKLESSPYEPAVSQQYVNGLPKRTCANVRLVWAQSFGCVCRSTQKRCFENFCFKVLSISEHPRTRVFHVLSLAKGVTGSKYNDLYLERSVQCVTCYF